ncbi:hypothetical protein HOS99_gp087 [Staphylococcus phage phiSA_BS1]|uniref:DNA polymerase n=2 Tax=Baoshanvirus TaxID=2732969 RepID=A0A2P1MXP1_9CAUD|nr:hypothetical protein HOS99_gp087 [Staphylococcus phage phiSA_BS1]YP_009800010.1 hypothetical protein HOT02_gp170 [Staphylococcus phage phiSA_BS2]AVP40332.1 hypothetical protein [Staphylococcus phage phiSA_BS1]AVR55614.1 hypothetical protein phiSABS2_170 [Staphylococcus phage phiSA_BS2]
MKFNTVEEVYAVVFGVLLRDEGKIVSSKFNKIINELGLDRVRAKEIQEIYNEIDADSYLADIKDQAIDGEITLDIVEGVTGDKPFEDKKLVDAVSNYVVDNKRRLAELREVRKQQEPHAYTTILMQDLREDFKSIEEPILDRESGITIKESNDKELVVLLSDTHIGYQFKDSKTGGYNFEILKERIQHFVNKTVKEILERDIRNVTIYFVGDLIEHVSMRNVNQAFDTEFTLSEQITKGTRLLIDVIQQISDVTDGNLKFGMIGGNHDRLQGNKNEKIYNDNVAYIVLDTLLNLQELELFNGIEIIDNRDDVYTIEDQVCGKSIIVNHGDTLKGNVNHIPKFIKDQVFDILITGHVHHLKVKQEDYTRQHITVGSTIGYNTYSKELNLSRTAPSQQLLFLEHNSDDIELKTIYL